MTAPRLPLQPASEDIWDSKYRLKDKRGLPVDATLEATYERVARALADVEEPAVREHWYRRFLWALQMGAVPAGRITSNAGAQEHKPATSLINCLSGDTMVLTDRGPRRAADLIHGPTIVLNAKGNWVEVHFKSHGKQKTYALDFVHETDGQRLRVRATANHRWILAHGIEITTQDWLDDPSDQALAFVPHIVPGLGPAGLWRFAGVDSGFSGHEEEVFCCEEPETHSFALGNGLLTGNCTVSDTIQDSMDDIMTKVHEAALTLKAGCVAPGTWVVTEHGLVTADEAVAERHAEILSYDREARRFEMRRIERHLTTHVARADNIGIRANGVLLKTSVRHPVLVYRDGVQKYVRADEVALSDALVQHAYPWRADEASMLDAWFAGAHLGDGSAYEKRHNYRSEKGAWKQRAEALGRRFVFKIRAAEREVVERYASFFAGFCASRAKVASAITPNGTPVWDYTVASFAASKAVDLIDHQTGTKTAHLRVPEWIARHPERHFLPFLAGLIDTDGTVSRERGSATIATQNAAFAGELKAMLGLFGVHASLTLRQPREHEYQGAIIRDSGGAMLKVCDSAFLAQVARFMADSGKRGRIVEHASQSGQYDRYVLPQELIHALGDLFATCSHDERQALGFYHGYHTRHAVSRIWLDRWAERFPSLQPLVDFARCLRPVEGIERNLDLPETFYDFTVEGHNNYLAGNSGLVVIHNCGIGYCFSTLRPRGAYVAGAGANTSGPLSFMDVYDKMCFTVASAGGRRGAQMGTFDVSHPDVREFIKAKREAGRLRQFNLSLLITDAFVEAVKNDGDWPLVFPIHAHEAGDLDLNDPRQVVWREWETHKKYVVREDGLVACRIYKTVKARHLWDAIMASTYDFAEPGFILIDRVNEMNNNWWCEDIRATNPCVVGDTLILTRDGEVPIASVVGRQVEVWNGEEWSQVTPRVTGVNQPVLRLTTDTGASLTCTPYHGFFLADGSKVEARELKVGDRLKPYRLPGDASARVPTVAFVEPVSGVASEVYCFTELKRHAGVFNGILTAQCGEQPLPPYGSCWTGSMRLNTNHGLIRTDEAYALAQSGKPLLVAVDDTFSHSKTDLRPCTLVSNGAKEVFDIRFHNGQRIELTADHRVYTPQGWKRVDELAAGSEVNVQSREMNGLSLINPFDLGMLKYLLDKHVGDDLVVTRRSRKAVLRPLLDRLHVAHTDVGGGIRVSRHHPVVREVEACDIETSSGKVLEGYAYAAFCTAARYKGKFCVYGNGVSSTRLARVLEKLSGVHPPITNHRDNESFRILMTEQKNTRVSAPHKLDLDFSLYGWLLADGWLTSSMGVLFSDKDDGAMELLAPRFKALTGTDGDVRTAYVGQTTNVHTLACYRKDAVARFRADLGLADYTSKHIRVPEKVFRATLEQQSSFLAAVFCADGSIDEQKLNIRLVSASKGFVEDVQMLLLNFGIHGTVRASVSKGNAFYSLVLRARDGYRYFSYIGFPFCTDKQQRLETILGAKSVWKGVGENVVETVASIESRGVQPVYDIEEFSTHTLIVNGVVVHNCLLGSLNLTSFVSNPFTEIAAFDWDSYRETVRVFTRMLDNVVELNGLPLPQQEHEIRHKRRHGMGFLGLGSALTMLRMPYGSPESIAFTEEVSREMAVVGWEEALALAKEKGPAPIMDEVFEVTGDMLRKRPEMVKDGLKVGDRVSGRVLHARYSRYMQRIASVRPDLVAQLADVGARFTHHTSIAPTGTISLSLANNASNGIEPSFGHHYSRNIIRAGRKAKEKVDVYSYELLAYRAWVNPEAMPFSDDPAKQLPSYFTVADNVTPRQHVDIQAASQIWIDSSISKTANVPTDFPYADFKDIYLYAHEKGLKGCTTFRFNPENFQGVLVKEEDLANTTYRFVLEDGSVVEFKGNEQVEYEGEVNTAANLFDALKEGYYGKF